ncbi:MAG TPA: DUF4870 domain-containing protein [Tepidisphaeraceae bacterium]|jgi:hypothetical protein|nr:DUF4870 domain-containing protein [Tepidisphaeraceae bacterium]
MSQDPQSDPTPNTTPPTTTPVEPVSYQTPATAAGDYMGPTPDKDAKMWGMLAHVSAIVAYLVAFPLLGPLIVWLVKKNEMPFVDDQGKESLNFQITVLIAVLVLTPTFCIFIGFILVPIVLIAALVLTIIAAMKANEGIAYRYPFTLRLIK